jgi:hypothetical protein
MKKKKIPQIKKPKIKTLPNKRVPLGGSPFVGRSTTG